MKAVANSCTVFAIAIGAIALVGWAVGLSVLTQFFTGRSAMQPMTALCVIFAGAAILAADRHSPTVILERILAALVLLASIHAILAHASGRDFGIDHLLFSAAVDAQPVYYAHPGRMAEPTASAFLLIALGVLVVRIPGRYAGRFVSASGTAVLLLVLIALLGHLYSVAPLSGALGFTQVSVPTATALGGMSIGLLALRPDVGWVCLLLGGTVGASAARLLLPVVVAVPVVVGFFALRGSDAGLYPPDFRLALTTAVTVVFLSSLALWGTDQLNRLAAIRRLAEAAQQSEATLRAFFETEGLFASIVERDGGAITYIAANPAFSALFDRDDVVGLDVGDITDNETRDRFARYLSAIERSGLPLHMEEPLETASGTRWFAVTVSPIARSATGAKRFATASIDISERKHAEAQQRILLEELNHRVKNVLAVVHSLAQQSFRGDAASETAKEAFAARLRSVASAHDLLVRQNWRSAPLAELIADAVGPGCGADLGRIDIEGPNLELSSHLAVSLSLALHELCTNAIKYGALSNDVGRVSIRWELTGGGPNHLQLRWTESGGPPVVAPSTRGFGSRLIERLLAAELRGPVAMAFETSGLVCSFEIPMSQSDTPVADAI